MATMWPLGVAGAWSDGDALLRLAADGLVLGCIYALVALGFVLLYQATEIVHFAQGESMMVGAFFAVTTIEIWHWNFWPGAAAAVLATAVMGGVLYRVVLRPLAGESHAACVLATLGIGFVLRAAVQWVPAWGAQTHRLSTPFPSAAVLGPFSGVDLAVVVGTVALCGSLALLFQRTRLGLAMRASAENERAAVVVGLPLERLRVAAWMLGAGVAAVAGILLAPLQHVDASMGLFGLRAFPAAVLGGFGSLPGAVVGGVTLGMLETFGDFLVPGSKAVIPFVVLLVVLTLRPRGLFGESAVQRV